MKQLSGEQILALKMSPNEIGAETVRDYLAGLLMQLWAEGESFSGKRPFGNSGWEFDFYHTLVAAGAVPGSVDGDYLEDVNIDQAHEAIMRAIKALVREKP